MPNNGVPECNNPEHHQQDNGVNEKRLECLQFLAEVASGETPDVRWNRDNSVAPGDDGLLIARVNAAAAYLAHTTFTDEEKVAGEPPVEMPDIDVGDDIDEWLRANFPNVAYVVERDAWTKRDVVVMFRNVAGIDAVRKLENGIDGVWSGRPK